MTETYRQLQREVHPDKFADAAQSQQLAAVQQSAQVNDGYQTLKQPLARAEYMLSERGIELRMEQKTLQDSSFLMQQMEYRERLEELSDSADLESELERFDSQIQQQIQQFYQQLKPLLISDCQQQLQQAANIVRKLKFMHKLQITTN